MMTNTIDWQAIANAISKALNTEVVLSSGVPVSGGDIHSSWYVKDNVAGLEFFVKTNHCSAYPVLLAEAESLAALSAVDQIKTPKPVVQDKTHEHSFLVMEYLSLAHQGDDYLLGQQLAKMHQVSCRKGNNYGFDSDNFIGLTPQRNTPENKWSDFWINQRINPQFEMAFENGFANELKLLLPDLLQAVKEMLKQYQPPSVLLHGDLWSGNKAFVNNAPVIFDPACYYGDRETDIAMTELFGGFSPDFYRGYQDVWPLDKGYEERKTLYNLYHLLNHLNLFGRGYLQQVINISRSLIG